MKILATLRHWIDTHRDSGLFNKYTVASTVFLVWVCIFDSHNLIVQYKLFSTVKQLERDKVEYASKLKEVQAEKALLESHAEQYARERYLMHRPEEEVFVIRRK